MHIHKMLNFVTIFSSYEQINTAAKFLLDSTKHRPRIGIICGSGLGSLADSIENADIIPYDTIPNFPISTVEGHSGKMIFGIIKNVPVMCMQGRFHYYEGYSLTKCSMPVRVMKLVGISHLIITNAAGSVNETYNVGDLMIIKDQINMLSLAGCNPLRGPNVALFGPRFLPMNKAYDAQLRKYALNIANELNIADEVHEGVYMCTGGPTYETVAESRLIKLLGADCVGMSTVHEVSTKFLKKNTVFFSNKNSESIENESLFQTTIARHCDIKVIAISFVSNKCITDYDCDDEPNHNEVVLVGLQRQPVLTEFIRRLVAQISVDVAYFTD